MGIIEADDNVEACEWTHDNYADCYNTACGGREIILTSYDPIENNYRFCPVCGKRIRINA